MSEMVKAYLVQQAHDAVRPLVQAAVRKYPGLSPDRLPKRVVVEIASTLPGAIKVLFPDNTKLVSFLTVMIREILHELKVTTEGRSPRSRS